MKKVCSLIFTLNLHKIKPNTYMLSTLGYLFCLNLRIQSGELSVLRIHEFLLKVYLTLVSFKMN